MCACVCRGALHGKQNARSMEVAYGDASVVRCTVNQWHVCKSLVLVLRSKGSNYNGYMEVQFVHLKSQDLC